MHIKRIEQQRSTHSSIRSILKPREPPIAFVIKDGIRLAGAEMNDAFVQYNAHHFQQPPRNGASAAIPGQVLQDLSPHDEEGLMNRMEHAYTNYYSILDGVYDLNEQALAHQAVTLAYTKQCMYVSQVEISNKYHATKEDRST